MNRPSVLSARSHIVSLCPYRHIYFISEPDSFRKRFGYVFLIGISAKGLFGTVNRNEQRHGITRPVICLPRYLGRFGSIAAHRKPVHLWQGKTHQTLCQGAQPPLKFLRSVYAHKQPNDQDLLYNVFFHWKVWYTRLNKMGFVEVVAWIGQKS